MTSTDYTHVIGKQLEQGLVGLQTVAPFDYPGAHAAAFQGCNAWRPYRDRYDAAWFQGRTLALDLWTRRMSATVDARQERDDAAARAELDALEAAFSPSEIEP